MLWRVGHNYWRNPTGSLLVHCFPDISTTCIKSRTFLLCSQWRAAALKFATVPSCPPAIDLPDQGAPKSLTVVQSPRRPIKGGKKREIGDVGAEVNPVFFRAHLRELLVLIDTLSAPNVSKDYALGYLKRLQNDEMSWERVTCILYWRRTEAVALHLAASQFPERSHHLLRLVYKLDLKLKHRTYERVVHQLAAGGQWSPILRIVNLAKVHVGRSTVRLLNWRTRALSELRHYTLLDEVLEEFKWADLNPNRRTFHLLITSHIRNRDLGKARSYLQMMEEAGYPIDASTYAAVVSVYRSLGPDSVVQGQALQALPDVGSQAATRILNSLMQFGIDAHDIDRVVRVMTAFDGDSSDLHSIATPGGDVAHHTGASDHQICGPQEPLSPDASTFARLISFMSKKKDLSTVLQVFYQMQASGVSPDANVVAALVRAYVQANDEATAVCIVSDMCPPTVPSRLLHAIGLASDGSYVRQAPLTQSPITVDILNALLKGTIRTHRLNGLGCILQIMRIVGVKPDATTIKIFLHYLDTTENARPRDMARVLRSLASMTPSPALKHVHKVLKTVLQREKAILGGKVQYTRSSDEEVSTRVLADQPLPRMLTSTSDGVAGDPIAGIRFAGLSKLRTFMRPIISSLISRGVQSDAAMYALRIRSDGMRGDTTSANRILKEMTMRGIHPNEYHYSAIMTGFAIAGNMSAAWAVLRKAENAGQTPNVVMYTILVSGYARWGQPKMALRTFNEMVEAGITPDARAVDTVVRALFLARRYTVAKRLLLELWTTVAPFRDEGWHDSLRDLVQEFRALVLTQHRPRKAMVSNSAGRMLRWKVRMLLARWRRAAARSSPNL